MRVPPEAVSLGRRCAKPPSAVAAGVSRRATPVVAIGRAKVPERRLGSSASRIPSPSRLTDITISRITGYHRHDEEHDHRDPQQSRNGKKQSRQNIPAHLRSPRFILAQISSGGELAKGQEGARAPPFRGSGKSATQFLAPGWLNQAR